MATVEEQLDKALDKIALVDSRTDSLIAFFKTVKQQLSDALAGVMTTSIQAKFDAVFANLDAHAADVDEALNSHVPPPPV